jgi:hypothetical protein
MLELERKAGPSEGRDFFTTSLSGGLVSGSEVSLIRAGIDSRRDEICCCIWSSVLLFFFGLESGVEVTSMFPNRGVSGELAEASEGAVLEKDDVLG